MDPMMAHTVLRRELTKGATDKYSVTQYCNTAGIGRGTFYSTYTSMNDLLCSTLQFEINRIFTDYHGRNLRQLLFAFIREIGDYRIYYSNIYRVVKKRKRKQTDVHICEKLNRTIFKGMQRHLINSDISNKKIKNLTKMLLVRIVDWVSHSCEEKVIDVYDDLTILIQS